MTDVQKLTQELILKDATRAKVIAIIAAYGDPVDWSYSSLDTIIGEIWDSDVNSGDDPEGWIINDICRMFGVPEVTA